MRVSKDAEIIELDKQIELDYSHLKGKKNRERVSKANEVHKKEFYQKRVSTDNANSYVTEGIIKTNWEKDRAKQKLESPGFTAGQIHSFSGGTCWDENGKLKEGKSSWGNKKSKEHKK